MIHRTAVRRAMLAAALVLAATPAVALAQIEKGDTQITLQGSLSSQMGGTTSSTSGNILGQYGYYLTRNIALRGIAMVSVTRSGGQSNEFFETEASTSTSTIYGGGVEVNLAGQGAKFAPYVAFDMLSSTDSEGTSLLGPSAGVRMFVSRNTAFTVATQYQTTSENTSVGSLQTSFGMSYFFGGKDRR